MKVDSQSNKGIEGQGSKIINNDDDEVPRVHFLSQIYNI